MKTFLFYKLKNLFQRFTRTHYQELLLVPYISNVQKKINTEYSLNNIFSDLLGQGSST